MIVHLVGKLTPSSCGFMSAVMHIVIIPRPVELLLPRSPHVQPRFRVAGLGELDLTNGKPKVSCLASWLQWLLASLIWVYKELVIDHDKNMSEALPIMVKHQHK